MTGSITKKVLIIGASGFLGNKLMEMFSERYEVFGTFHSTVRDNAIPLDIRDSDQVRKTIKSINPDIVILASAITDVDRCEVEKELADAVNVHGVVNVTENCVNRKLVYYSTDSVFDGNKGNYIEKDQPNPINHYSKTKLAGEKIVKTIKDHLILRICMIYSNQMESPKFVNWLIKNLHEKRKVKVATDLSATPTLIDDVVTATLGLIDKNRIGLYHVAGASALNCYEMANCVAEVFTFDKLQIIPSNSADLNRIAKRPKKSTLNIGKLKEEGIIMSTFEEGLKAIRKSYSNENFK